MTMFERRPYFAPGPASGRAFPWWLLPLLGLLGLLSFLGRSCAAGVGSPTLALTKVEPADDPKTADESETACPAPDVVVVIDRSSSVLATGSFDLASFGSTGAEGPTGETEACTAIGLVWFAERSAVMVGPDIDGASAADLGNTTNLADALSLAWVTIARCDLDGSGDECGRLIVVSDFVALPEREIVDGLAAFEGYERIAVHVGDSYAGYDRFFDDVIDPLQGIDQLASLLAA